MNQILKIGQEVAGFRVTEYCKTYGANNAQSYKVVDDKGVTSIMKIMVDGCASVEFAEIATGLMKAKYSLPRLLGTGTVNIESIDYQYLVREMNEGVRLSHLMDDGQVFTWEEAVIIIQQVLSALCVMHMSGIVHNDVTPRNVFIDDFDVTLVGFGHLSPAHKAVARLDKSHLNPWYMAPETFRNRFNVKSDIFSAGALLYTMIFGTEPWREYQPDAASVSDLREARMTPASVICSKEDRLTRAQKEILCKMLEPDLDKRYESVQDVVFAIADNIKHSHENTQETNVGQDDGIGVDAGVVEMDPDSDLPQGFAAVAGMTGVKAMLSDEVMYVLKNPDKVKKYRLKVPNGMLFYGPPGCGKTFIANKFAQESQLSFMMVKASDIGSTFVHGTQGKIKELFDKASANAPTILCFDELDGMVPDRSRVTSEAISGEVNEFLTQLNNCSDRGIFVIGTTNRPNMIDPALLRSGRLDNLIYIPMPDEEARKDLFRIHLTGRPLDEDLDFGELASATEGYVASDIELIVNKAALEASKADASISQELLMRRISITRRSVSDKERAFYDEMNRQMESSPRKEERKRIGFVTGH